MANENASVIKIQLKDKNGKQAELQNNITDARFSLSDDLISEIIQRNQMDDLESCSLVVGANNIAIQIIDYTKTASVNIENFYNVPSSYVSILQVKNVGIHIVKQKIDLLQADCSSVLLADCQVNHFDAGLDVHFEIMTGKHLESVEFEMLDIRNSNIHTMQLFLDCKHLNIQDSNINALNMYGNMKKDVSSTIQSMSIQKYSSIFDMTLYFEIEQFKLEESTISNLIAKCGCFLKNFENQNGVILNAYNFCKENFENISSEGWALIAKSAANQGLLDKRAEAQYHIVKAAYQRENGIRKIFGRVIDFCTGFGYKPIRAIRACIIMIIFSWALIAGIDIICSQISNITTDRIIMDSLLIAITAITGQSGLNCNDGFSYWIAFGEYIGAVILFAMFVNALYVRYKE